MKLENAIAKLEKVGFWITSNSQFADTRIYTARSDYGLNDIEMIVNDGKVERFSTERGHTTYSSKTVAKAIRDSAPR